MDRSETLTIGDHVYVDDELRTGIECVVRGFNDIGEPILQAVENHALRFKGVDRRVLDFPWSMVSRNPRTQTLLEAAEAVVDFAHEHWGAQSVVLMADLRAAVEREKELPF